MKLATVLRLCNNIPILRKYTLKCLGIKGHEAYNVLSNGSEKIIVRTWERKREWVQKRERNDKANKIKVLTIGKHG